MDYPDWAPDPVMGRVRWQGSSICTSLSFVCFNPQLCNWFLVVWMFRFYLMLMNFKTAM